MNDILTIAIDPGVNGGIAWHFNGKTTALRMPPTDFDTCTLLANVAKGSDIVELYIELPPLFVGKNIPGSAVGKMMLNYGICYGAAVALGFKIHPVRPPIWQKAHPVGTKGDRSTSQWKNVLKQRASELYPDQAVTLATGDAFLIYDAAIRGAIN